jgi:hypothetical protein
MPWIAVDLDGTLAEHHGGLGDIGAPIEPMRQRVLAWLTKGYEVRIFTARAEYEDQVSMVQAWCELHLGQRLAVTRTKDFAMTMLWDDRCVQVVPNTGQRADGKP